MLNRETSVDVSFGHGCQSKPAREPPCEAYVWGAGLVEAFGSPLLPQDVREAQMLPLALQVVC